MYSDDYKNSKDKIHGHQETHLFHGRDPRDYYGFWQRIHKYQQPPKLVKYSLKFPRLDDLYRYWMPQYPDTPPHKMSLKCFMIPKLQPCVDPFEVQVCNHEPYQHWYEKIDNQSLNLLLSERLNFFGEL